MIINGLLFIGMVLGALGAAVTFFFNSSTPLQLGPVPFFAGIAFGGVCLVALIARISTGHFS